MNDNNERQAGIWAGAAAWLAMLALASAGWAATTKPAPAFSDVSYGPEANQLLDIYLPAQSQGAGPWPVLLWYGGIWKPSKNAPDPHRFLPQGCALVAVETRTMSQEKVSNGDPPVAVVMNDACRAVQFVRLNAAKWNIDPARIALGGGSQGTLPALYVACAGERANPKSADPVERISTKVLCVGAYRSQPSIDPKRMQEWVPGVKWGAPALGCSFEESLRRRDELLPLISRWSPDALVNKETPPIYFENEWGLTRPESVTETNYKVHSPAWALGFQKLAEQRGATCYVKYPDHPIEKYKDIWDFLVEQMKSGNSR
jgi:acetyl esterase/lipase